jgi:hypothetical protein
MKKGYIIEYLLFMSFISSCSTLVYPLSIATNFATVNIEKPLDIGKTYNMRDIAGRTLNLINRSDKPVSIKIEVIIPESSSLPESCLPIPSRNWVRLSKNIVFLEPHQSKDVEIKLKIPYRLQYLNKKYAFFINSCTIPSSTSGIGIGVGLESKVIFTISGTPPPRSKIPVIRALQEFIDKTFRY